MMTTDAVIVDVNGIGYQVHVPLSTALPSPGNDVTLYTVHYVREDIQALYGFQTQEMRHVFTVITGISGIGPKLGMKILSALHPSALVQAILKEDLSTLTQISGVGKKMAERIIVELKDNLPKLSLDSSVYSDLSSTSGGSSALSRQIEDDLTMAMKTLGYSNDEIKRAIKQNADQLNESVSLEKGIKILLKSLS